MELNPEPEVSTGSQPLWEVSEIARRAPEFAKNLQLGVEPIVFKSVDGWITV